MTAPLRAALLGYGLAGRVFHAPFLAADPAWSLDVVVTSDAERSAAARADHPGATVLPRAQDALERADELDVVVVATPNHLHVPQAQAALDAGLHVVVDKPVAVTSAQARALVTRAADAGRVLTVFQNRRWDGDFRTLRRVLESGDLGDVVTFESAFEWWKPQVTGRRKDQVPLAEGGGILYDLGPHLVDQAVQLFGPVVEVHAEVDARRAGAVNDDDAFVSLRHETGVRSRLWMSALAAQRRPRFRVLGTRGAFVKHGLDPQEHQLAAGVRPGDARLGVEPESAWATVGVEGEDVRRESTLPGDYAEFYRLLAAAVRGEGPVPVDPEDAVRALEVLEAAHGLRDL